MKARQALVATIALAILAGCGAKNQLPARFPVRGQVLQAGKPVADAIVTFHPVSPAVGVAQKPIAYSDGEGRFSLTTFETGDGAPEGEYAVTVELRAQRMVGEEVVRDGRNLLPVRYGKPDTSKLTFKVAAGENEMPPIDMPRSRRS